MLETVRPSIVVDDDEICQWRDEEIAVVEAIELTGLKYSTFCRFVKQAAPQLK